MSAVHGSRIRHGAAWTYVGQVFLTAGHFIVGVILARLLGPGDFGVFIAVTAFSSVFLMGVQFGLPQAILQAKELDDSIINAAFWTMFALALVFFGVVALTVDPLSGFYDDDRFAGVMYWMAGIFLLTPYTAVGLALMRRRMLFDRIARIQMISFAVPVPIAVTVALAGAGVYALVLSAYLGMIVNTMLIWYSLKWRPMLPAISPVGKLFGFSGFMTLNNLLHFTTARLDNMVVGALLGTTPLGLYNRAYSLSRIPSDQFAESLGPLMLGSLSRIQDDISGSRALYFKAVSAISTLTLPFMVFLFVAGPVAIEFLYGQDWIGAGEPLRVMVIGAVFLMLALTLRGFLNAQGMVRQLIPVNILALLMTLAAVVVLSPWGLIAISVGISLREVVVFVGMLRLLRRSRVELQFSELGYTIAPSFGASAVGLIGGMAALYYGRDIGLDNGLMLIIMVGLSIFVCYATALLALMTLWRSHAPLASTRGLMQEGIRGIGYRMRLSPRAV